MGAPTAGHPGIMKLMVLKQPLVHSVRFCNSRWNGVGLKMLASRFNSADDLFSSNTFVLASDGCIMEGITSEASSLAGHLKLDNLIVIYDSNDICLDGPTDECLSEDTEARYQSYGWYVQTIDGHSFDMIETAIEKAKKSDRPSLIIAKTVIGKGSPKLEGTSEVHGKPLGNDEVNATKDVYGIQEVQIFLFQNLFRLFSKKKNTY